MYAQTAVACCLLAVVLCCVALRLLEAHVMCPLCCTTMLCVCGRTHRHPNTTARRKRQMELSAQ